MIRLTLNAQSDPEIHLFNKSIILIGTEAGHVDLIIPGPHIHPIHLKIEEQNGFPVLINYANDPFVSINGHPFGKKLLNSGDIIVVHETTLLYENLNSSCISENDTAKEEALALLLENKIKKQEEPIQPTPSSSSHESAFLSSFSFPFEQEVEVLGEEELQNASLDSYLKELETPSEEPITSVTATAPKVLRKNIDRKKTESLKDDYLRDLEDDNQGEGKGPFKLLKNRAIFFKLGNGFYFLYYAWQSFRELLELSFISV